MSISEKIEEIRQKPESVRLKYVWALVVVSMILVMMIWFFSITVGGMKSGSQSLPSHPSQTATDLNDAKQQLKNATEGMSGTAGMIKDQVENQKQ